MCGVIAAVRLRKDAHINLENIRFMLNMISERGRQATGLAFLYPNEDLRYVKEAKDATLCSESMIHTLLKRGSPTAVIGHTRHATSGPASVIDNNHPHGCPSHKYGAGLFVHNGWITGWEALAAKEQVKPKTGCDSEVAGLVFTKYADETESPTELLKKVKNTCGLSSDTVLYLTQSAFMYTKTGSLACGEKDGVMYFCSTKEPLLGIGCLIKVEVDRGECRYMPFDTDGVIDKDNCKVEIDNTYGGGSKWVSGGSSNYTGSSSSVGRQDHLYENYGSHYQGRSHNSGGSNKGKVQIIGFRPPKHAHVLRSADGLPISSEDGSLNLDDVFDEDYFAEDTPLVIPGVVPAGGIQPPIHGFRPQFIPRHDGD